MKLRLSPVPSMKGAGLAQVKRVQVCCSVSRVTFVTRDQQNQYTGSTFIVLKNIQTIMKIKLLQLISEFVFIESLSLDIF